MGYRARNQKLLASEARNMSIYMVFNSDKHSIYFPQNKPYDFKVHLIKPLNLTGKWMVSLVDFSTETSALIHEHIYLYCDICGDSIIDGSMHPLLRRFWCTGVNSGFSVTFPDMHYKSVSKTVVEDIHFYIKDVNENVVSFLHQPVSLTLHLKPYPFWTNL